MLFACTKRDTLWRVRASDTNVKCWDFSRYFPPALHSIRCFEQPWSDKCFHGSVQWQKTQEHRDVVVKATRLHKAKGMCVRTQTYAGTHSLFSPWQLCLVWEYSICEARELCSMSQPLKRLTATSAFVSESQTPTREYRHHEVNGSLSLTGI